MAKRKKTRGKKSFGKSSHLTEAKAPDFKHDIDQDSIDAAKENKRDQKRGDKRGAKRSGKRKMKRATSRR